MNVNRAIARLATLFIWAYALLFVRQLYVGVIAGPTLARNAYNSRLALLAPYRGAILARDGTVLARSTAHGRVYPFGAALAHAVGYASARYGTSGLEAAYDSDLAARPLASNAFAQIQALIEHRSSGPIAGSTIVTTIDPAVQQALYDGLRGHARAAGVALDPRNGDVLALASVPSFDPATIDENFHAIANDDESPLLDRALDGLYPPGSTFKIFIAGAALDDGTVAMASTFEDPGELPVGNFIVHDNEGEATGTQDLTGAFALSSNVDFARIALMMGVERWYDAAAKWGFGEGVDFALPVARDRLPARAGMTPSILAQLGFGQADLLVTPLRMALVSATVAAAGTEPRPVLVRAIRTSRGEESVADAGALATPISSDVASDVRSMMVAVVERGTGTAAALPGVTVAGKTGTATNPAGRSHAWFVAFAPASAPRVAVAIVVENAGYGGDVAAPIARGVIAAALARTHS